MNRKTCVGFLSVLILAVGLVACGKSSNPASPSATASTGQAGATINGTVSGTTGGTASGYQKLDGTNGVTVTISGTGLTVAVDAQGKFTFTGVPAGSVQIVFTAGGSTATLTLDGIKTTDKITIHVTLKGTTATLDDEQRNGTNVTELEGQISKIDAAGKTIDVETTHVDVSGATFRRASDTSAITIDSLHVGDRVHVRGTLNGTTMTASEVKLQNTNTNPGVNASGNVSSVVSAACPASVEFVVDKTWTVYTNASTDFQKMTCADVKPGASVHFKGEVQQPSGKVLATWIQGK